MALSMGTILSIVCHLEVVYTIIKGLLMEKLLLEVFMEDVDYDMHYSLFMEIFHLQGAILSNIAKRRENVKLTHMDPLDLRMY